MKFSTSWSEIANQNIALKIALVSASVTTIALSCVTINLALKEPLVVERSCYSTKARIGDSTRTNEEIEAFVEIALAQRFNTDIKVLRGYLSANETAMRAQEQKELASRQLTQRVILNSVKVDGSTVSIDATRIVTVGTIRSALPLSLIAKVESQERDDGNAYGLILSNVKVAEAKEVK